MTQPFLEARSITKRYEAVVALDNARLEVREGEVMGLVGDNGAGKSTLIKVISGVVAADSGRILLGGREVEIRSPRPRSRSASRPSTRTSRSSIR